MIIKKQISILLFFFLSISLFLTLSFAQTQTEPILFGSFDQEQTAIVDKIYTADMIGLRDGRRIQMIGLKALSAPKRKKVERDQHGFIIQRFDPTISLEEQAYQFTESLLGQKRVRLEFDYQYRDDEGRILAYVFLEDNRLANAEILRAGYAELRLAPANKKYDSQLRQAYQESRSEKRGLHGAY